jgi:hypothetical protein
LLRIDRHTALTASLYPFGATPDKLEAGGSA